MICDERRVDARSISTSGEIPGHERKRAFPPLLSSLPSSPLGPFARATSMWGGDAPAGGENASFRFNFGGDASPGGAGAGSPPADPESAVAASSELLLPGVEVFATDVPDPCPGWTPETIRIHNTSFVKGVSTGAKYSATTSLRLPKKVTETSDLVKGAYEGGAKLWECAVDLTEYLLAELADGGDFKINGSNVLELGCGHGLPGIACALLGAKQVVFQDYNPDVLRTLTVPNARANGLMRFDVDKSENDEKKTNCHCRFLGGDWGSLAHNSELLVPNSFQVVLCAETVYELSSFGKHVAILKRALAKNKNSLCLVAAKSYYFGVGGGSHAFAEALKKDGAFDVLPIYTVSDGVSNVREILKVTWKEGAMR
jgi:predicted nicotinamide N-methyase